ncbi:cytochrome b [Solirhodobacter olei]|uniref:cytochrome b n=1 Tax=Solirhodobacter olei TaxID=2493082 RepID=UPI000FD73A1B|nr:cytochrome b/b6 domain-containing protein [Solirhodobacter olei]
MQEQAQTYDSVQIFLHWAMALLIASQFAFYWIVLPGWHYLITTHSYLFTPGVIIHLTVGTAVLVLVLWRLQLKRSHAAPPPPKDFDPRMEAVAHVVQWATYLTMVLIPLTGILAYFFDLRAVSIVHNVLAVTLLLLVGMHASGALYHQFVRHDGLLLRMKPGEES